MIRIWCGTGAVCALLVAVVAGCSLTPAAQQSAAVENLSTVSGRVAVAVEEEGDVHVLLFRSNDSGFEIASRQPLLDDGSYLFYVTPGRYTVGAFVDADGDGEYLGNDPATYHGERRGEAILVEVEASKAYEIPELTVSAVLERRSEEATVDKSTRSVTNIGSVARLDDERFSQDNARMGLWRPVDFLDIWGAGLYMLQDYEADKIPVLFVHGINGTPINFRAVLADLDRERFQPWVLHYPSGVRLDMVSEYMLRALQSMRTQHHFAEIYVVAHSMGGLMTRSFVLRHHESASEFRLGLVMTVNSPLYGMDSAAAGVRTSPVVLPSWRDVASGSEFVQRVHASRWPEDVPYHLVFSFQDGEDGDGVVPMRSQLSRSLQREALRIHGFNSGHATVLEDAQFLEKFAAIMRSPVD